MMAAWGSLAMEDPWPESTVMWNIIFEFVWSLEMLSSLQSLPAHMLWYKASQTWKVLAFPWWRFFLDAWDCLPWPALLLVLCRHKKLSRSCWIICMKRVTTMETSTPSHAMAAICLSWSPVILTALWEKAPNNLIMSKARQCKAELRDKVSSFQATMRPSVERLQIFTKGLPLNSWQVLR